VFKQAWRQQMQPFCSHAAQPFTPQKTKAPDFQGFLEADEGTRTLDLLHGKGARPFAPVRTRSPSTGQGPTGRGCKRTAEVHRPDNLQARTAWTSTRQPLSAADGICNRATVPSETVTAIRLSKRQTRPRVTPEVANSSPVAPVPCTPPLQPFGERLGSLRSELPKRSEDRRHDASGSPT
jgi:hypothetical protein